MENMVTKVIAPYFVAKKGSHKYKDEVDGKIKSVSDIVNYLEAAQK